MIPKPPKRARSVRPGRLKGKALEQLRRECFERDGYRCQHDLYPEFPHWDNRLCLNPVTWESGHMAHIRARSLGGSDTLDNVTTKCFRCHIVHEHGGVNPATGSVHRGAR